MTRGGNQLTMLYTNLVSGGSALTPEMQERIFSHAKLTKNIAIAAALAKRVDTTETIDEKLAKWNAAKIQAAWYLRPGRPVSQITEHLERENRITVLESLAGLENLDVVVYDTCAKKNVARVAIPLFANPSAGLEHRAATARTLACSYDSLSYEQRSKVREILSVSDDDTVATYVVATNSVDLIKAAVENRSSVNEATAIRVCEIVGVTLAEAEREWINTPVSKPTQKYNWTQATYVKLVDISVELLQILQRLDRTGVVGWEQSIASLMGLYTSIDKRKKRSDDEDNVLNIIGGVLESLGTHNVTREGSALRVGNLTDPKKLLEMIKVLDREDKLDTQTIIAAITNPYIDLGGALYIGGHLRWNSLNVAAFVRSHKDTLSATVLGAILVATWMHDDDEIGKLIGVHSGQDIWQASISAMMHDNQLVPQHMFESKYASIDVIPQLPFSVFSQNDLPDWLVSGMGEYLAANLELLEHWDSFEVLAKGHVGTVEQLVRGSKLATRRTAKAIN